MTASQQHLVFIHGVGGSNGEAAWLGPLSESMAFRGHSRPDPTHTGIVTMDYRQAILAGNGGKVPPRTWHRAQDSSQRAAHQVRRAELDAIIRAHRQRPPIAHFGAVGEVNAERAARLVEGVTRKLREEARRYRTDARARAAVLDHVLQHIPDRGHVVLIGHSLGSVIAADAIKRLPSSVHIDLLLTIGSPLPLAKFWPFIDHDGDDFPFDRVGGWVNVFDSRDPVTSGRGIGERFPDAVDAEVHLGTLAAPLSTHSAGYYLSLPVVGELVGDTLNGKRAESGKASPSKRLGPAWDLYLLSTAYATQVSKTCDAKKHRWRFDFDVARHASVVRLLGDTATQEANLPEAARGVPTRADFLDHAAHLVRGKWTDDSLVAYAVGLLMASPVRPFEIGVDAQHAEKALTSLLDRVRRADGSDIADHDFAEAICAAVEDASDALGGRSSVWAALLLSGAAVLAATGVGVWAAIPAGVAGAAVLTATLAAFGPGGMVGGMITIAAASGVGSALLGAGAVTGSEGTRSFNHFTGSLADLAPAELRGTCTALIAVALAQRDLGLESTAAKTVEVLTSARTQIENEENAHASVRSDAERLWTEKKRIADRTLTWFAKNFPSGSERLLREALDHDDGALLMAPEEIARIPTDGHIGGPELL